MGGQGDSVLDEEDLYALSKVHRAYRNAGAGIEDEQTRKMYLATVEELNDVVVAAKKLLNDADEGVWFNKDELDGVPRALLERMQHEDGEQRRYRATFVPGQYMAVMKNARNAQTRKTLQNARENRFPENLARLKKAVALRDQLARMLGFAHHAEKKMESRMAESVDAVLQRLGELTERLRPVAEQEKEVLFALKQKYARGETQDEEDGQRLNVWDLQFYKRMLEEERFSVDSARVSEYFEVHQSLRGMLGIFEDIFGMRLETVEAPTWQPDVMVYTAWDGADEGGEFLGYLYLDLFMRPGKYKGARCSLIEPVCSLHG
jgi:metallopeptidase MepB